MRLPCAVDASGSAPARARKERRETGLGAIIVSHNITGLPCSRCGQALTLGRRRLPSEADAADADDAHGGPVKFQTHRGELSRVERLSSGPFKRLERNADGVRHRLPVLSLGETLHGV